LPRERDLPAFRDLVARLPGDDELLPFLMAIVIPELAEQLDLVRDEPSIAQAKKTLARLLKDFDFEHPERLAQLDWVRDSRAVFNSLHPGRLFRGGA